MGENEANSIHKTSSQIKDLIQLVKNGKINKTEAFQELKSMLIHKDEMENIPPSKDADHHEGDGRMMESSHLNRSNDLPFDIPIIKESYDLSTSSTTPRFSKEDRRLLINKLIEKKRQDKNQSQSMQQQSQPSHRYQNQHDDDIYDEDDGIESPELSRSQQQSHFPPPPLHDERVEYHPHRDVNDASSISSIGIRSRSTTGYQSDRRRPHSAGPSRSKSHSPSYKSTPFTRRSLDDSKLNDYKNHKIALQNNRIQQEVFKECTFTPKVKPLPVSIYGQVKDKDVQFYDRVMRWQREKELEANRRKSLTAQTEVDGCTFQPKINKNSSRAVKILRGNGTRSQGSRHPSQDTSIRLYESNAITQSQRSKFIEEEKVKEIKMLEAECTFQPRLLTKRSVYSHVDPKYDKVKTPTVQELKERSIPPPKDCTFTPKVSILIVFPLDILLL